MTELEICRNCGHSKTFHKSSGGLSMCDAIVHRFPKREYCKCRKYLPDYSLSVTPETKELLNKVERGEFKV